MRVLRAGTFIILAMGLLPGCRSATLHLYTLVPSAAEQTSTGTASKRFVIAGLSVPREVDRRELVVRQSVYEIRLLDNNHWAAQLRDEVRQALILNLQHALKTPIASSTDASSPTLIWIDIRAWDATSRAVSLTVEWRLRREEPDAIDLRCESTLVEKTSGGVDDLVRADQTLLEALAQPIARILQGKKTATCDN
jgi:uncharacterized lipoprotein YmbA